MGTKNEEQEFFEEITEGAGGKDNVEPQDSQESQESHEEEIVYLDGDEIPNDDKEVSIDDVIQERERYKGQLEAQKNDTAAQIVQLLQQGGQQDKQQTQGPTQEEIKKKQDELAKKLKDGLFDNPIDALNEYNQWALGPTFRQQQDMITNLYINNAVNEDLKPYKDEIKENMKSFMHLPVDQQIEKAVKMTKADHIDEIFERKEKQSSGNSGGQASRRPSKQVSTTMRQPSSSGKRSSKTVYITKQDQQIANERGMNVEDYVKYVKNRS